MGALKQFLVRRYQKTSSWVGKAAGVSAMRAGMDATLDTLQKLTKAPKKSADAADFAAVVAKHGLCEQELAQRERRYYKLSALFVVLGLLCFLYACLQIKSLGLHSFFNFILAFGVLFLLAARYSFYAFLIRERDLSLSLGAWLQGLWRG